MLGSQLYNIYPFRDPICVSHYPNPVDELSSKRMLQYLNNPASEKNAGAVYIHVPFCAQVCIFCPFNKVIHKDDQVSNYVNAVKKEIDIYASTEYAKSTSIQSIYFGGGTPSALSAEQMVDVLEYAKRKYNIEKNVQISFEGSPSTFTKEKLKAIYMEGANRISIGVQTFDESKGKYLHLSHSSKVAKKAINDAFEVGFKNVGIDLMYNLPEQTMNEWIEDLKIAVNLDIKHITIFSLCVVPSTPLFDMIKAGKIPPVKGVEYEIDMYIKAKEYLEQKGYIQYSVWDFAKPNYIDKHVILYYTKQKDLFSHGPGAFGYINKMMYINEGRIEEYLKKLENDEISILIGKQANQLEAMHGMMAKGLRMLSVSKKEFKELFSSKPEDFFADKIEKLVNLGLIENNEKEIKLSDRGIIWGNNVCKEFFSTDNQQTFENRVTLAKGQRPSEE